MLPITSGLKQVTLKNIHQERERDFPLEYQGRTSLAVATVRVLSLLNNVLRRELNLFQSHVITCMDFQLQVSLINILRNNHDMKALLHFRTLEDTQEFQMRINDGALGLSAFKALCCSG